MAKKTKPAPAPKEETPTAVTIQLTKQEQVFLQEASTELKQTPENLLRRFFLDGLLRHRQTVR